MPLSPVLAQWLVGQGHDAVHASALKLATAPDTIIMAHAKQDGRIVVTADLDYPRLLALNAADGPAVLRTHGFPETRAYVDRVEDLKEIYRSAYDL